MTATRYAEADPTAFWNVNVKPEHQTVDCPEYLRYCFQNDKDRGIIGTADSAYQCLTWDEVKDHANRNRPDLFQRVPSELRKYRWFCHELRGRYGSILEFILKERLQWSDTTAVVGDFGDQANYKILFNDWPYGVDERIVHLIVWTKFEMPEDPVTGALVPEMQAKVEAFVHEQFAIPCGTDNVAWFRNWVSLKSVHAVEHIHIMLFQPDEQLINRITNGDQPLALKLGYITRGGAI
ncbi:hypothetical protein AMS68_005031 [Peltaster fructicola]|uniref:N-acetylglucosamine-induced protein 1 n=1 Tax=Peltaster fructicola TaxID=286661 RepID=A0A6H0XXQ6_9PEZI|nr:hypothetical protein AMS68_005031 [Peltaster fructicola]